MHIIHLKRLAILLSLFLSACQSPMTPWDRLAGPGIERSSWKANNQVHAELLNLPKPKGQVRVSVYSFRDQTGQFKPGPASSLSSAVTQGASFFLVKALKDSGWFVPLEREGLQNILTERKIILSEGKNDKQERNLPSLMSANIIIEGGIVGYDFNIKTGGAGIKYFGIGASEQYRVDQVTVNIRAVDSRTGYIINSVTVTKSILSKELNTGVFRFVKFKRLLEAEAGYTLNEPSQLCVLDAIETAVIRLIVTGITSKTWALENPETINNPIMKYYLSSI